MDHQLEVGSEKKPEQRSQMLEVVSEHKPEQRSQEQNGDENNLQQKTKLDSQCDTVVSEHQPEQRSQVQQGDENNLQQQAKLDNRSVTGEGKQDTMGSAQKKEGTECTLRHLQSPKWRQDEQLIVEEEENQVENRLRPEQRSDVLEDNEPNLQQQAKLDNQSDTDEENQVVSEHRPEQRSQGQNGDENNLQQKTKLDSQCDTVVSEHRPEQRSQEQDGDENNLQQKTKLDSQCGTVISEHRFEQRSQGQEGDEDNLLQQAMLDNQSIIDAMDSAQLQKEGTECTLRHLQSPICRQDEQLNEEEEEIHVENRLRPEQRSDVLEDNEPKLQQQAKLDNQSDTDEENQVVSEHRPEQRSQGQNGDENNLQQKTKLDSQSDTDETCEGMSSSNVQPPRSIQDAQLHQDEEKNQVENVVSEHRPEQRSQGQDANENNLQQKAKLDNQSDTVVSEHRPEQRSQEQDGDENNLQQKTKLDSQCGTVISEHRFEQRSQGQEGDEDNLLQQAMLDNQSIIGEEIQDAMDSAQLQKEGTECTLRHLQSPICRQDEQLNEEEEEIHVENRLRPEQSSEAQEGYEPNLQQQAKLDNQSHTDEKNQGETCEGILLSNVQSPVCRQDGQLQQDEAKTHVENGQWSIYLAAVLLVPVACIMLNFLNQQESEVVENKLNIFLQNFDNVQKSFPNQDEQLWKKSRIMLQKHINMTVHSEPSILMFAAAWNANETMHCLTDRIAEAYASAFNSRFLKIEGSSKKFLNSDKVKLDLDNQLTSWFGAGSKSAVIHHFQDLPPPSTLLFYKYCDHENAAFKDVSLLITVLVDEEKLDPNLSFSLLEERVYDFLMTKFSISSQTGQYNTLDIDKFSGLWSRIAHVILPVLPEKDIEKNGCKHK
ncbi:torsin-1A-interacting protein 2-like isoform X2 [Hemiscyllium ocellatum]|uniref:torsin-1A-interacting protein 2-like isoform X2 n=1 Tax=Hemiscyllium ocellatum TaxID=170820 RepID=UPI0029666403|nr:torsin-1A-interacting protein 2-like isoform X2 [Hemiscyllium ocellatum]